MKTTKSTCTKCNGTGKTRWMHVDNGRCFECLGVGVCETKHIGTQKVASRRDPAQERQSFINKFNAAIRNIKADGKACLDEIHDTMCPALGTERDVLRAWITSDRCPADVRARAAKALAELGVTL